MSSELLSTNEAAAALQVGASTVKRWADEGRLQCVKTAGGHRRFRRGDIAELLAQSGEMKGDITAEGILSDRDGHATLGNLYQLRSIHGSWTKVTEHIGEFLREIGERWRRGEINIVEEHTISERLTRAIASVLQTIPTPGIAPTCLMVMAEGDDHTLGLRLAELVVAEAGWQSRWVGRNTPLAELESLIDSNEIAAVAVSASEFSSDKKDLIQQVRRLETMTQNAGVSLALGGHGAWPSVSGYATRVVDFESFRSFLLSS